MKKFTLYKDASGTLKVKLEGDETEYPVTPIRYFPLTAPKQLVGLFRVDSDGSPEKEIVSISSSDEVDEASLKILEEELRNLYPEAWLKKTFSMVSVLNKRICHSYCDGKKISFEILNANAINMIRPDLVVIRSADGKKYFINPADLDRTSKMLLECYL